MLTIRIIPCLDVHEGRTVKGINFKNLRDAGNPVELAAHYSAEGADELVFLDISASKAGREIFINTVMEVAKEVKIPFTVGGGIASVEQILRVLEAGADKVSLNTAIVRNPGLLEESAAIVGTQNIIVAIDARKNGNSWEVYIRGGSENTGIDALEWSKKVWELGAGELLVTSMDRDGTGTGFDNELLRRISEIVEIPVIASGGAGTLRTLADAIVKGRADAILAASIFHYNRITIGEVKRYLAKKKIPVRL